jgi:hypothetical protein
MKGWCPVHDRVFETPDGDCPECGTRLVAVEEERPGGEIERVAVVVPEQPSVPSPAAKEPGSSRVPDWVMRPSTLIVVVVFAIVGAFLIGLDASGRKAIQTPRFGVPNAVQELNVGRFSRGVAGVDLRLESFSQRGRRIVMRVTVPPETGIPTGSIQSARVEFFGPGGSSAGIAADLPVRVTLSGFIIDGSALERADIPVVAAQIDALTLSAPAEGLMKVTLSGVWPPDGHESPRVKTINRSLRLGSRRFTLTSLVGWPDRIEARLQVTGERPEWNYDDEFALVIGNIERRPGSIVTTFEENAGLVHVVFDGPRRLGEQPGIIIDHSHLEIAGQWRWELGSR